MDTNTRIVPAAPLRGEQIRKIRANRGLTHYQMHRDYTVCGRRIKNPEEWTPTGSRHMLCKQCRSYRRYR